jgi:Mrp family chromosome partitioning ATPase
MEPGPLRACAHRAPSIANLWLMPAGLPTLDVRPVLGDADTQRRLRELFDTFDHVIAYTAPIGLHADATLFGSIFDGVVLVVDASTTKPEAVRSAADALGQARVRLLGTVLNNPRPV